MSGETSEKKAQSLRHELRNKLAAVRNAVHYVDRRVGDLTNLPEEDPRVVRFFALISDQLEAADTLITQQLNAEFLSKSEPE